MPRRVCECRNRGMLSKHPGSVPHLLRHHVTGGHGMADFLQLLFSGAAIGAIYALAALGFTLLWQASGTINFAQGEFVMLPAFVMLFFLAAGAPLWLAFLLTCVVAMLVLGCGFKRVIVDPLLARRHAARHRHARPVDRRSTARAPATAPRRIRSRACFPTSCSLGACTSPTPTSARCCSPALIVLGLQVFLNRTRDRPRDAGGGPEHRDRHGAGHQRAAHGPLHVPDQRGAGLRRGAAGHADVPRQVRHGRLDRPQGVLTPRSSAASTRRAARCSAA